MFLDEFKEQGWARFQGVEYRFTKRRKAPEIGGRFLSCNGVPHYAKGSQHEMDGTFTGWVIV